MHAMELMQNILSMNEGHHIDDAGNVIEVTYVDLRRSADRSPIPSLIKSCKSQHAIERSKQIRISKPSAFQENYCGLINDPSETRHSSTKIVKKPDTDDTTTLQPVASEASTATKPMKNPSTTSNNDSTDKITETYAADKNGWMFSTSIKPTSPEEKRQLQSSMNGYDHTWHIYRPREFARALGSMVAEQIGPQGGNATLNHAFADTRHSTEHKKQTIYHGPVVYADEPFDKIFKVSTEAEFLVLPLFVKKTKYRAQNEYRFLVLTEREPTQQCVDLDVSPTMLESTKERTLRSTKDMQTTAQPEQTKKQQNTPHEHSIEPTPREAYGPRMLADFRAKFAFNSNIRALINDPTTPLTPQAEGIQNLPLGLQDVARTHAALETLRESIGGPFEVAFRPTRVPEQRYVEGASAAWHAEPCIWHMCAVFDDPIKDISTGAENTIDIRIKFPEKSGWTGKIIVYPSGRAECTIENGAEPTTYHDKRTRPLRNIVNFLKKTDIHVRQNHKSSTDSLKP